MLYKPPKIKKNLIILVIMAIVFLLLLILANLLSWWKNNRAVNTFPEAKHPEAKQKKESTRDMLEGLLEANKNFPQISQEEQLKKQQEMQEAIKEINKKNSQPISREESERKQQDTLRALRNPI